MTCCYNFAALEAVIANFALQGGADLLDAFSIASQVILEAGFHPTEPAPGGDDYKKMAERAFRLGRESARAVGV